VFLYLAVSGGRVYLPGAISVIAVNDGSDDVGFFAADGTLIAVFRRQDVSVHSTADLGLVIDETQRSAEPDLPSLWPL